MGVFYHSPHSKNTDFDILSQMTPPLWKSWSQHTVGAKVSEIRGIEEGKRNSFILLESPLSQGGTSQYQERPPRPMLSSTEEVRTRE